MKNEEKTTEEKIFHFEKLTPTADADTSVYEKALDFVFSSFFMCTSPIFLVYNLSIFITKTFLMKLFINFLKS